MPSRAAQLGQEVKSSAAGTDAPAAKYRSGVALEMCCEGFQCRVRNLDTGRLWAWCGAKIQK